MGYFDGLVAGSFKSDEQGNHYVMPFGILGKARRFRTEQDYFRARQSLKVTYQVMLPLIIVGGIVSRWTGWMALLPLLLMIPAWALIVLPRITRNSVPTEMRESLAESYARSGREHSGVQLVLLTLMSIAFTAGGVFLAIKGLAIGYLAAGFFGLCTFAMAFMTISRRKLQPGRR